MTVTFKQGDCRDVLAALPAQSVQCCVTSPPYFGLRDYGTAQWQGGDAACDHLGEPFRTSANINANWDGGNDIKNKEKRQPYRHQCGKCGAIRIDSPIGLEATPAEYVAELVAVFREVRRVLRDDGTLWLNLGDSYGGPKGNMAMTGGKTDKARGEAMYGGVTFPFGKPKDLLGIPWRVAFALQADGWYLRQDIIWSKPNPMPESVTDRCTKAHEYIFLMSKSARYFYDAAAIAEPFAGEPYKGKANGVIKNGDRADKGRTIGMTTSMRNRRSVWEVASQPFAEAHFATFPPDMIEPCIKAGCPKGGTVLDPFGGAGTTGLVADRLGRSALLIELNPAYVGMAENRLRDDAGMFAEIGE